MDPSPGLSLYALFADFGMIIFAFVLVLLNGFFVAAEFAMVKLRATKVESIAERHGWRGRILRTVHSQLDAYLSACQLGITLASLGLGWVGEPAFAHLLEPALEAVGVQSAEVIKGASFFTAFFVISYLHIVVGELAPKSWAIRKPELLSLWTAVPLYLFYWLMYPAIWLLNASANAILRIAGQGEPGPHHEHHYSRDELKLILYSSRGQDPSDQGMRVLASAVEMGELEVVDWANSREDLVSLDHKASLPEILEKFRRHKYSRFPVYNSELGEFVGLLHIKDLLLELAAKDYTPEGFELDELLRPVERVSRHMPLSALLEQFRQGSAHFALVEEADGKVIGYLTMEDVLEVLVGDIQDEHRKAERGVLAYQPGKLLVRGDTPLFKVERLLGVDLDHIEAETLAGLVYDTLKRVPEDEEVLEVEGLRIIIKKMKGPKIVLAKVLKLA
ncbi:MULTISPECIES: hemolysin family protein [unclassified Pseudomonas]|uniref:hemolysin family protein n=1 Tax=unclassified Pseudomonas TaxID=196821 RepID=UPI000BD32627|nr:MULTISPECIES: hemolysin family protein [unclassified Pseudomonas]PVZ10459.1 CBS domain containing-hemolysin-like protein [Pseudomonas sp. URIL14HWK12:I12]PVZ21885.1 CBS domain containing-hemolysin-like protein [Pseudomonas sp. URIL14HWK12:I10]PVZ31032.1 CBS domain containing-hemolysin-like protein [Pseudomonas sp. URIL14HWK12:I11]SNZ17591.1 Hemolysin, contains CBS domains [Pseudomonas sp. URIL14HWK12:I9]